jgi:hypothetical protein
MRVYFDLPDDPYKACGPFPLDYPDAAGHLFVVIKPKEGKLEMLYTVGRESYENADPVLRLELDRIMKALEAIARSASEKFNEVEAKS